MALPFTQWGSLSRSAGIYSAFAKQAKLINYGAAERVTFAFDPFLDETQATFETRRALVYMNCQNLRATNPKCVLKTDILSDRRPPSIEVKLVDGSIIEFKTLNLSTLDILKYFNQLVSAKAPKKKEASGPVLQTKAEKAAAAGSSKKSRQR